MEKELALEESATEKIPEKETEDIFAVKEVEIEEIAIDGVCGVY